jgi:hypothetical protein
MGVGSNGTPSSAEWGRRREEKSAGEAAKMTTNVRQRVAAGEAEERMEPMRGPNRIARYWTALRRNEKRDKVRGGWTSRLQLSWFDGRSPQSREESAEGTWWLPRYDELSMNEESNMGEGQPTFRTQIQPGIDWLTVGMRLMSEASLLHRRAIGPGRKEGLIVDSTQIQDKSCI